MRIALLVGIAALAALGTTDAFANRTQTERTERRVVVVSGNQAEDIAVYQNSADRAPVVGDYRSRWQGEWNGAWETPDGRAYEGNYQGSFEGAPAPGSRGRYVNGSWVSGQWVDGRWIDGPADARPTGDYRNPGPPPRDYRDDRHDRRRAVEDRRWSDDDLSRMCRRDGGVTGAVIGGVVGGVAGNRIAGRGNRTAGTIIGAGVGAVAGGAIDAASARRACDDYWARNDARYDAGYEGYQGGAYYPQQGYSGYGYPAGYGYGYTVVQGPPVVVEETITTYENVAIARPARTRMAQRRAAVRRPAARRPVARRVAPRPCNCTCVCR